MATLAPTPVVRLPEERNLDRLIDISRVGAQKDNVTVIIERKLTRKDGTERRIPILEISPKGDVSEVDAPRLRVTIGARLTELELGLRAEEVFLNSRSLAGHIAMCELAKVSRDYLQAERDYQAERRHNRRARDNRNTRTLTNTVETK